MSTRGGTEGADVAAGGAAGAETSRNLCCRHFVVRTRWPPQPKHYCCYSLTRRRRWLEPGVTRNPGLQIPWVHFLFPLVLAILFEDLVWKAGLDCAAPVTLWRDYFEDHDLDFDLDLGQHWRLELQDSDLAS